MKGIVLLLLASMQVAAAGIWVTPAYVGNGAGDSVIVSLCTFDTTYYPKIADADSIVALRYGPSNTLLDSLTQTAANVFKVRTGWYDVHYRGADGSGTMGIYRVYVRVRIGGDWRGAASVSYCVIGDEVSSYFRKLSADSDSLKDTLGVLLHLADSARVARSVWDDDVVSRMGRRIGWGDTVGVVNNMPASGTGAYACTLFVLDAASQAAVQGVFLRVLNSSETATIAIGESNTNGRAIFSLDAAEYHLLPYLSGYNFEELPKIITVTVSGAADTIWASAFDPGNPLSASLCRVYGYVQTLGGGGLDEVVVTARIQKAPLTHEGVVISPYAVSTSTDSTGYWYLDLIPNADLEPDGTKYDFTLYYPSGTIVRKQLAVPDSASFWFR